MLRNLRGKEGDVVIWLADKRGIFQGSVMSITLLVVRIVACNLNLPYSKLKKAKSDRIWACFIIGQVNPRVLLGAPSKISKWQKCPWPFFHYKSFFFPTLHTVAIFVRCFSLFLWFSCGIVSGSLVHCERLGAVKVKVHCGGRRRQTRYAEGGGCVTDVRITYGST